jgi:hypothetical protein
MPYVSLHGRQIGYDTDTSKIQTPGFDHIFAGAETSVNASTAANIKWRGAAVLHSTAAGTFTIDAPVTAAIGAEKIITSLTTSTAIKSVRLASGNYLTTAGSTGSLLTFNGLGQNVRLLALSTALVQILVNNGATLST